MEKKYLPTPHKLKKLKKKGEFPKSSILQRALTLTLAFVSLVFCINNLTLFNDFDSRIFFDLQDSYSLAGLHQKIYSLAILTASLVIPPLVVAALGSFLLQLLFARGFYFFSFLGQKGKFNIVQNSLGIGKKLKELPTEIFFTFILILLGSYSFYFCSTKILLLFESSPKSGAVNLSSLSLVKEARTLFLLLLSIGLFDYFLVRSRFTKKNRMTLQEIKDEYRETEGDSQVKSRRDQLHYELLHSELVKRVKNSKFLVVG
jgi:flagellar biosynthesis protein FlhB